MSEDRLSGRVAVVPVGDAATARIREMAERLAAAGAAVVLVTGEDGAGDAGRLAAGVEAVGKARPAVFHIDDDNPDLDALVEFVGEMFRLAP